MAEQRKIAIQLTSLNVYEKIERLVVLLQKNNIKNSRNYI